MTETWTPEDSQAASAEGWDVFTSYGEGDPEQQLQRNDDDPTFPDDGDAWKHVRNLAATSPLHAKALRCVSTEELRKIMAI